MKRHFFSWKSRINHKTHKYNQNQQQSHVPYKNSPQHQIFYIKEKTHIYILVSPCGEYLLLCGWLTEHQNSKTYLSLYTTSWTIYITQTNKLQSSTLPLLPQTLESTKFCANGLLSPPNKNTVSPLCFYPTLLFQLRIEDTLLRSGDHELQKLDLSNWIHFMNLQRTK